MPILVESSRARGLRFSLSRTPSRTSRFDRRAEQAHRVGPHYGSAMRACTASEHSFTCRRDACLAGTRTVRVGWWRTAMALSRRRGISDARGEERVKRERPHASGSRRDLTFSCRFRKPS